MSAYAKALESSDTTIRIGIFNSQKAAQSFFEHLPDQFKNEIDTDQLWLNAYASDSGLTEYYLDISSLYNEQAEIFCAYLKVRDTQCVISHRQLLVLSDTEYAPPDRVKTLAALSALPASAASRPKGLSAQLLSSYQRPDAPKFDARFKGSIVEEKATYHQNIKDYGESFSLASAPIDTPQAQAAKAAYSAARNNFVQALQNIGRGVNAGESAESTRENLLALGRSAFEAAGETYLSGFLAEQLNITRALSESTGSAKGFVQHVTENLEAAAHTTLDNIIAGVVAEISGEGDGKVIIIKDEVDKLILSGARSFIDAGLSAARRSDLYALRNLELEYTLNDYEDAYFSVLMTQPVYQSADLRHNIFLQGSGILNEQSVDIDDDVARHTLNLGVAYRHLTHNEKYLFGGSLFLDHQWPYNHSRLGIGFDAKARYLDFATNYYLPLSDYKDSRRDDAGNQYEERALEGFDVEIGYSPPALQNLSVFGKGYQYFKETDDDIRGMELRAEYTLLDRLTVKGAVIEENGGRDGIEFALQYTMPLYDTDKPNIALADLETASGSASVRDRIFEKIRRENRIRVEERLKEDNTPSIVTAQFNALSTGLPFDVGGTLTAASVNLPFNTAITIPNGDFAILNFDNGAIANISASGVGDVVLEFNNTTLSVTATNGGFVQFISGSGGISIVNVPGGVVNLLGTDIDVSDDGTNTTVQIRSGAVNVVPAIGAAVLAGAQADIVNLAIASGTTSLLAGAPLEARQEAAFTNLDLTNPDPPLIASAAPFVKALPALISGPQFAGNTADIRLTFTKAVTITGAPQITGLVGVNARTFIYNAAASSPTQPVFRYSFVAGDVGSASLTIENLDLNGGAITGASNGLAAITAFTDTILAINDQTAPSLSSTSPVDDDPLFSPSGNIVLNFNENIQAGIGNITITDTTDGSSTVLIPVGDARITIATNTLTINPIGPLDLSSDYEVTFAAGVVEDLAGNDFIGIATTELSFTTANDATPPALITRAPTDNQTGIALAANIVLSFDEDIQAGTGNILITDSNDGSDSRVIAITDPQINISGMVLTINPTTDFEIGTDYDVTIASGVIEDLFGNAYGGLSSGELNFSVLAPVQTSYNFDSNDEGFTMSPRLDQINGGNPAFPNGAFGALATTTSSQGRWVRHNSTTPSNGSTTGPLSAQGGSHYIYTEGSGGSDNGVIDHFRYYLQFPQAYDATNGLELSLFVNMRIPAENGTTLSLYKRNQGDGAQDWVLVETFGQNSNADWEAWTVTNIQTGGMVELLMVVDGRDVGTWPNGAFNDVGIDTVSVTTFQ
mgnify:CR=1 FL=1